MEVSRKHGTTKEAAIQKIVESLPQLLQQYGSDISDLHIPPPGSVMPFSFQARELNISGSVTVTESEVSLEVDIPWPLRSFIDESLIRAKIGEGLEALLGKP